MHGWKVRGACGQIPDGVIFCYRIFFLFSCDSVESTEKNLHLGKTRVLGSDSVIYCGNCLCLYYGTLPYITGQSNSIHFVFYIIKVLCILLNFDNDQTLFKKYSPFYF